MARSDSLTERFAAQVVASPDALALWALDERLSYRDLDAQAAQLAARLRALGVGAPGQAAFVGLSLPHGREAIVAFWAILRAGGVVVPLDPKYPPDRLAFMVADSAIDVIITARAWVDHLPPSGPTLLLLDVAAQGDSLADAPLPTAPATSFACCLYTSGSTGRPKGVLLEHEALVAHCDAIQAVYQYTPDDRVLLFASLNYVAALEQLLAPLLVGATVIVREPTLWSAVEFPAKVRHYGLTVVDLPPGYWQTLLDAWVRMPGLVADLPLRMVILGGEATTPGLVQRWYQTSLGHIRLLNAYGMTETPVTATLYAIPYAPGRVWERIPIGRPTPQRTAYVLDAQRQPVPQGEVGELYVGGAGLAWGYLNQPELTTARFSTDPFSADPTARLYQTGDLARWLPDGNLEYLGRADDQVQIRGHRIELGEVEAALSSHPAVQVCVVALREVAPGDQQLVAYVVLNEPDADLRSYLYARLPDHMVPSAFVSLDALPLTPNRKVDRKALPAPDFSAVQRDYVAAQTDTERQLAAIWQEVLNLARVGLYDNFFDLGGHSLLAIQAIARINDCYRIELPLRLLFEHPTIAGMAPHVAALRSACPPSPGMPRQVAAAQRALGPRPARLPLSFAQQRLWLMDQLGSGAAYNLPVILALTGSLQLAALQASLDEVVRRHESLRTTFAEQAGVPTQSIQPALSVALPRADLRALPAEARQVEAQRLIHAEAQRPFDLRHDVLLRALLIEIDDQQSVLVLTLHHIASDGWSMGVFMEEITSLYRAHIQGAPSPLPPLPLQYADFALWQRAWLQGARLETQLSYWRTQLAGAPPLLELPFAQPRPSAQRFAGSLVIRWIDTALVRQLRQLGQQASTTLFMTMLSAFQLLLFRYTGQTDLVVGSPIANRQRQEFEPLIGLFVNTLALRARLSPDMSFAELLAQVRQTTLEAYTHQDLPFERLVEELHPERTLAYTPLVQIIFALHNAPAKAWALPGLQAAELPLAEPMVRTDMEVHLWEIDNTIEVQWLYNTALIEPTAIERMATHYQTLLESIVAAPARPISQLPLLTETERQQLLVEWNATAGACQQDQCAHQLFEAQVAQSPDAVAVEHENQQLTYRQLNARANQVAHQLQALGVGPDVLVGLCVERSLDMVVGLLGILKAGGAYVPLDPSYPSERLAFMLEDAAAPVLLTQARLRKQLPPTGAQVVTLDEVLPTQRPSHTPSSPARPEQLAYVIYTSGSTGQPKAALLTHRGLTNATREQIRLYGITAASRVAQAVSFSFDVATGDIFMALCSGASLVLLPPLQQLGGELGDILQAAAISHIQLPSPVLAALPPTDLPALQTIVAGGDVVSAELAQRWGGGRHLYNAYGPTEATIVTTVARCLPTEAAPPIGRPIAHAQLYVLDPAGQPLPVGVPGELYIGGAGVARGYLNRPDLSAARFVSNPFGPGQLYKSGDRVRYRADGNLEFLGRLDQQVKLRGFRIELGEIESQLRTHPAVRDAVVLIREDQPGERHLVAYVTTLAIDVDGEQARVSQWQATADQIETPPLAERDQESKFKGWNCSCTGRAIPSAEMQEWLDHTVADILALQPQRIFEIGCGTGLLLERIAPACELYWGADFSRTALREAQRLTASRPDLKHVTLQQRLADDITDLPSAYFDLIILNSVVQYFPSIDYLLRVLTGAAQVVKPGGAIYVGDVRSLPLLKAYHAFVQCHQASPDWTSAQLALQIQQHLFDEKELVIDPAFFVALQGHLPQIQDVQIQLKRGRSYNELTSFRYQVLLRVGGDQRATTAGDGAQGYTLDWYHGKLTLSTLREMLRHERPRTLVVRDIPNARLQAAAYTLDWLDRAPAQRVAELREQLVGIDAGIEPEALWSLGAESGYAVTLCWPASGAVGCMDLYAQDAVVPLATLPRPAPPGTHAVRPWSSYANNPLRGQLQRTLVPQLREFLHRSLPEYMIPALFVLLDHLPLTPNGKLDRNALPEPLRVIRSEHAATPRTPTEQALASIWASVLGLDHVGIHDNFFALGGDSISSMQIVSRAAQRGMALSVKDLFQHQTIATLAQAATALVVDAPTDRGSARGVSLLSFYQEDAYLLSQSTTEATTFRTNHVSPYRLRGRLDLTALQQSFNVIIQRHEILRTIYLPAEQALSAALPAPVMQTVVPQAELCLARLDLRALPQAKQETAITRLRDQEELTLLDFTQAPVLRATLVQQSDDQHLLLLTTHHINVDGWSTGILLAELSAAYRAFVTGEPLSLPPLTVQYADFAAWQRRFYTPEVLAERQRYWRQLLAAPPPPLRFRLAHTRPGGEHALSAKAGSTLLRLPPLLVGQLKQVGQQCQASLAMLLLTAYAIVLARHAGVEDLLIGSPTNNRSQPGLDLLIGHFSALSFLRIDLTGAPTIAEALARVKAMLVLALSNQDITLRQLLRLTPTGWLPTGLPAAQAIFNYIVLPEQDLIDLPGLQLESVHLAKTESPRALTLFITETNLPSGDTLLKSDWMYRQDVFDAAAIARMQRDLQVVLQAMIDHPQQPIGSIPLL